MKIRKLIFSAKLEQIEKQNQNIFIFQCSANASQWRFLKNFLFFYGQHVLANKTSELRALESGTKAREPAFFVAPSSGAPLLSYQQVPLRVTESSAISQPTMLAEIAAKRTEASYLLRGFTYFQSTIFKKNSVKSSFTGQKRPTRMSVSYSQTGSYRDRKPRGHYFTGLNAPTKISGYRASELMAYQGERPRTAYPAKGGNRFIRVLRPGNQALLAETAVSQESLNKKFRPKGCLFFFHTRSSILIENDQKNASASFQGLELVNKTLSVLEFNHNLILLYGQMNSTVVNHVDIKETFNLDAQATYQQFFVSMHSLTISLTFCLHQKIDEFFWVQQTNRPQSNP